MGMCCWLANGDGPGGVAKSLLVSLNRDMWSCENLAVLFHHLLRLSSSRKRKLLVVKVKVWQGCFRQILFLGMFIVVLYFFSPSSGKVKGGSG